MEISPGRALGSWSLKGLALGQVIWQLAPSSPACKDASPPPGQILARMTPQSPPLPSEQCHLAGGLSYLLGSVLGPGLLRLLGLTASSLPAGQQNQLGGPGRERASRLHWCERHKTKGESWPQVPICQRIHRVLPLVPSRDISFPCLVPRPLHCQSPRWGFV